MGGQRVAVAHTYLHGVSSTEASVVSMALFSSCFALASSCATQQERTRGRRRGEYDSVTQWGILTHVRQLLERP